MSAPRAPLLAGIEAGGTKFVLAVGHAPDAITARHAIPTRLPAETLAEQALGAGKGANALAYVTVGTGIGGGLVIDGRAVHGAAHPEMGHIYPRRPPGDSDFAGSCPYHGDCLEGLASGPAIKARWGASLSELPADHEAHGLVAHYLAELCHTLFATTAVPVLVLGGGVMETPGLIERVATTAAALDRGYLPGHARRTIVRPGLGGNSGIAGALMLAQRSLAVA